MLGAGASATSLSADGTKHPPTWIELLEILAARVPDKTDRDEIQKLTAAERFLDAAQIIRDKVVAADFDQVIRQELQDPDFQPAEVHDLILKLDPKVVITTNYDDIYERNSFRAGAKSAYNALSYRDQNVLDDIRSTRRLIIKVHGSMTYTAGVILSRADYFNARREFPSFYSVLDALFLTSTLLFVGSSVRDPDIQLLLENANISAPSNHPHYAVVEASWHASLKEALMKTYNLHLLEYPIGKHADVTDSIRELEDEVTSYRSVHLS